MTEDSHPKKHRDPAVLVGLIDAIVMMASTRQVTSGDRLLTVEELQQNAQETLDSIARECDLLLGSFEVRELRDMRKEWLDWRNAKQLKSSKV